MKQTVRLKRGMYVLFDSYKRPFLYHLRPKASWTTAIFAVTTFSLCMAYAVALPRFLSDADSYQSAPQTQGRASFNR